MSYFDEKARQTSVDSMLSFGIPICSRYAKANDLAEMLMFTHRVALLGLHEHIKNVFYDTKACLCVIELHDEEMWYDEAGEKIKGCAEKSISQFQWAGTVGHGDSFRDMMMELDS
ncbi:hypothetical protein CF139_02435 [Aeromonas hydrophila]|uniref:hypothetical protein n=1 Tax=Aeromonas hydrophila TaxID=644 RepID=UPI001116A2CC|nr:hypothetical protein [Aeromonas hydrophila]TNH91719.1 hypothetical protein CF139_02435 [Aeromonas hydrophila]